MFESKSLFRDYHEMGHIWAIDQIFKIRTRLFKPADSAT